MCLCNGKKLNLLILVSSLLHLLLSLTLSVLSIVYFSLYDNYYFLVDNPISSFFMTMLTFSCFASFSTCLYSLYVSDKLATFFNQQDPDTAASDYMSTFLVKVVKGIALLCYLITFVISAYDFSTLDALFYSKGILKALQAYKSDKATKVSVDRLQMDYECCGHLSYTNWTDANVDMEPGPMDATSSNLRFIPFSCCNTSSNRPCVHEIVGDNQAPINYYFPHDLSIYNLGCSIVMKGNLEGILRGIVYTISPIFLCEVVSLICFIQLK